MGEAVKLFRSSIFIGINGTINFDRVVKNDCTAAYFCDNKYCDSIVKCD